MAAPESARNLHAPTIPPPRDPDRLLLIARWKGLLQPAQSTRGARLRHAYTLAIWPDEPIVIGRTVKILAATPMSHHSPNVPPNHLDTHDPHVTGRVVEVWRMEDGVAVARIVNDCLGNEVDEAEVEFPYRLQKRTRPERRTSSGVAGEATAEDTLGILACVRPTPTVRECLGRECWLRAAKGY